MSKLCWGSPQYINFPQLMAQSQPMPYGNGWYIGKMRPMASGIRFVHREASFTVPAPVCGRSSSRHHRRHVPRLRCGGQDAAPLRGSRARA